MAADPWNRVNIPFPGAVSSVQVHFSRTTASHVKQLCSESWTLLQLLRSEALQTEVRLLYDLLHVLNNSMRGNKTFRALKQIMQDTPSSYVVVNDLYHLIIERIACDLNMPQEFSTPLYLILTQNVEQCINRLKDMKLDVALQDLTELCPTRMQRGVSLQAGEGAVPSQPTLEWLCLKVLGAAELMSCTLSRCSRAFILSRQQMKWDEFIISNTVITSMLSRLWVFFRGALVCLASLYQRLLELLREVAQAKPMPFLTDFSLPADMAQFLGPSSASLLTKKPQQQEKQQQNKERKKKAPVKIPNQAKRQRKEDLGVAVQRDQLLDIDVKPLFKGLGDFKEALKNKSSPEERRKAEKKQMFKKQVRAATTFTDMATHLQEMIEWCKSQSLVKEKRLLSFLYLKCQKMKGLESEGHTIQKKLRRFKREVCWASSPGGSVPRTCLPIAALWRNTHLRTRLRTLRARFRPSTTTNCAKKKEKKRRRKTTESSGSGLSEYGKGSRTSHETSECEGRDDIDDIFASVGL